MLFRSEFLASPNAVYDKDKEQSQAEKNILTEMVEKLRKVSLEGEIVGIIHLVNNEVSDDVKAERQEILFGRDYINEELLGLKFKITTFSFFQTNSRDFLKINLRTSSIPLKASGGIRNASDKRVDRPSVLLFSDVCLHS